LFHGRQLQPLTTRIGEIRTNNKAMHISSYPTVAVKVAEKFIDVDDLIHKLYINCWINYSFIQFIPQINELPYIA
jgi:hypothetical protein